MKRIDYLLILLDIGSIMLLVTILILKWDSLTSNQLIINVVLILLIIFSMFEIIKQH